MCVLSTVSAQNDTIQQAINQDVWHPFIKSYRAFDTDGFMAIHTKDIIRINRDGNEYLLVMNTVKGFNPP